MPSETKTVQVTPSSRESLTVRNRIYGVYPGIVEYNLDPLHVGRVKVRVPLIHQTEVSIDTKDLPWAVPILSLGGVHDVGSYNVPPTGATVYVQFMAGDPEQPLYFGGWYKTPTKPRAINFKVNQETGALLPEIERFPVSAGYWFQPIGPEIPSEIAAQPYHDPTVRLLLKSVKGHTFIVEDRDEFEKLDIIDRSGQQLTMHAPVTKDNNDDNSLQRGRREARAGDEIGYEDLQGGGSTLELVGTNGQRVRMFAGEGAEFVEVVSRVPITPDTPQEKRSEIKLTLGAGLGLVDLVGVFQGTETFRLQVHTPTGELRITSAGGVRLDAQSLAVVVESIELRGNVQIGGDLSVGGSVLASGRLLGRSND